MDTTSCLSEWYNSMDCIAPKSKAEEIRLRLLHHCYFNTGGLVEQVENLIQVYGTGDHFFEPDPGGARTRHVFVAALTSNARIEARSYNLFRSYASPHPAKLPQKLLEGYEDPSSFKISSAFEVTGAAKYFPNPWKEQAPSSGKISTVRSGQNWPGFPNGVDAKLRKLEDEIESDTKRKLNDTHPGNAELYFRLAPDKAPQGTSQNGSSAAGLAVTLGFLSEPLGATINQLVKRIPDLTSTPRP